MNGKELPINVVSDAIREGMSRIGGISSTSKNLIYNTIMEHIEDAYYSPDTDKTLAQKSGPPIWESLHWFAKVADNENKPYLYHRLLDIVEEGLPCKDTCRPHIPQNLSIIDPNDYSSAFQHSVDFHNLINRQLGKPLLSRKDADIKYNLDCNSCIFTPNIN